MLVVGLCQALFGCAVLVVCGVASRAVLRRDPRSHFFLTLTGSLALVFFVSVPGAPFQMIGVALISIIAGILMTPAPEPPISFDSTATRRSRR